MAVSVRMKLGNLMRDTIADEAQHGDWTYRAVRPTQVPPSWTQGQKVTGDCSKGVQFLCRWAGGPDPMQNGFGVNGNSQTIWLKLHHVNTPAELEVGDIVTFGRDGREHAAAVMEAGTDPLLWSFGHPGTPNAYRLSWDTREHQLCKLPVKKQPPTHADVLRSMSGFYAWLAWSLGEGITTWKPYGRSNKTVRPNVPKLIPPGWWLRRTQFLLARKKGNKPTAPVKAPA